MLKSKKHKYWLTTWDSEAQDFTPQAGVWTGPYTLWGLRRALRALRDTGYQATRSDPCVYI